jgi:hypothetical protein
MWTPEEEAEEEEEQQQPNQIQEDQPEPPLKERQPQPPVTVHDDDPRLRTHRNFSWEKGHQIEAVEGDGNCLYRYYINIILFLMSIKLQGLFLEHCMDQDKRHFLLWNPGNLRNGFGQCGGSLQEG